MNEKRCYICGSTKPVEQFRRFRHNPDGLCDHCRECSSKPSFKRTSHNHWSRKNLNRVSGYGVRSRLKIKYDLTPEQLADMAARQNGKCAICLLEKPLRIDHNHQTGEIRDLLCDQCNLGIGNFMEDPKVIARARLYVMRQGRYAA